jgi:hypothetical protein
MRHGSWFLAVCAVALCAVAQAATPSPKAVSHPSSYYVTLEKDGQLIAEQEVQPSWSDTPASRLTVRQGADQALRCATGGPAFVVDHAADGASVRLLTPPDGSRLAVMFHAAQVRHAAAVCGPSVAGSVVDGVEAFWPNVALNQPYTIQAPEYKNDRTVVPHTYVLTVFDTRPTVTVHWPERVAAVP